MPFATEESLARLLSGIPNEENRAGVHAFLEEKRANGARLSTLISHGNHLRHWGRFMGARPFTSATKDDVRGFVNDRTYTRSWRPHGRSETRDGAPIKTQTATVSQSTIEIRKVLLKAFQRWLRGGTRKGDFPPEVAWLEKAKQPDAETVLEEVLTRDELHALIQAQEHGQHRALLATLYDSGMRAGEFVSLRLRDVTFDEYGAVLTPPKGTAGLKTGSRRVRVLHCTPYLKRWVNEHPRRKDANARLWVGMSRRAPNAPLTQGALYALVQRAAARAGIEKQEMRPHLFRHSRATEAVKEGMREAEMRIYFGWSRTSDMPTRYIHLAGADVEEGILRRAGKLKGTPQFVAAMKARACAYCATENGFTDEWCSNKVCGKPLLPHVAERAQADAMIAAFDGNRDALARFADLLGMQTVTRVRKASSKSK